LYEDVGDELLGSTRPGGTETASVQQHTVTFEAASELAVATVTSTTAYDVQLHVSDTSNCLALTSLDDNDPFSLANTIMG
jgi:hypothetical protein